MRDQEIVGLWESYLEVCDTQQLDELSSEVIARTSHKRMQNLDAAQKEEDIARDAGATMGERSKRAEKTLDAAAKVSKNRSLSSAHARSRSRMNKEEVEAWVNDLIEEGYDLSEYTWEEMYEAYANLNEAEVMKHQKERSAIERRKKMKGYEPPTKGVHGEIERRQSQKPPSKLRSGSLPESYDIFDVILEYLVYEGYADTNESAIAIMANMSEEWREDILNELDEGYKPLPKDRIKNKAKKLAKDTLGDVGTTLNPFKSDYEKDVAKHNMRKREKRVNKMVDALKTLKTQK